jgi:putative oxidoreductase
MALLNGFENYGLLLLRLALGAVFIYHGTKKLGNWKSQPGFFRFLGVAETLGSLAMIAGFLTQFAGIGLAIIMAGAIYKKTREWHVPFSADKTTGWEFDMVLFAVALALVALGAGTISVDALAGFYP